MKRYLTILLICLLPFSTFAAVNTFDGQTGIDTWDGQTGVDTVDGQVIASGVVADHCADGCNGESDADILCEDWENAGSRCTWSSNDAGNGSINEDASHSGSWACNDIGSQCLEIVLGTDAACYVGYDHGSETSAIYMQFYIKITSESLADGNEEIVFMLKGVSSDKLAGLFCRQDSGNLELRFYRYNWGDFYSTALTISTGTIYRIRMSWVDGTTYVNAWIDSTQYFTDQATANVRNFQKLWIGDNAAVTNTFTFQGDCLKLDDDTMPGACE